MKPFKQANGKYAFNFQYKGKRYRKQGMATKKEAEAIIRNIMNDLALGIESSNKIYLHNYFENWLEVNKMSTVSETTYKRHVSTLNKVKSFFPADLLLKDLTRTMYQEFLNHYAENLSKESMDKIHQPLKSALEDAKYSMVIKRNPAYKANVFGKIDPKPENLKYLPLQKYIQLKETLKQEQSKSALLLYILHITGGRFSEVNQMKFDSIDTKENKILLDGTKTAGSKRWVSVPRSDIEYILTRMHTLGIDELETPFDLSHKAAEKKFNLLKSELDIDMRITIHSLRHTHCSYLYNNGISIYYISRRLGHSTIKVTLDTYSHLFDEKYDQDDNRAISAITANKLI